ncbi:MAG TPA: alpha/beta fold hydrolase [Frankiaceae bacterium]|jgi:pimeloyl-ACP methyl ester carboxylesterase|nr:alpha/beta fold hydrolase [Frankiaceae bacterium]
MRVQETSVIVHGHRRAFTIAGDGPPLLLLHGIGSNRTTWHPVLPALARKFTVVAPDLLGHGDSAKPRADYSIGGFANGMRDLLGVLGIERATVVGHSFGGGVAMQFAYQFPERTERVVLEASGGLGREVTPLLRALTLPGARQLLTVLDSLPGAVPMRLVEELARRLPAGPLASDIGEVAKVVEGFQGRAARKAFLHVLSHVIDWRGQIITMRDRSYLAQGMPIMVIWGDGDTVLPFAHATAAAESMPHSRLVTVAGVGHFVHVERPAEFSRAIVDFVRTTAPSSYDPAQWRALLKRGAQPFMSVPEELEPAVTA